MSILAWLLFPVTVAEIVTTARRTYTYEASELNVQ